MKSTNLRMTPDVYEQITALSEGTNVPLNTAIVLCMKGIFDLINADPDAPQPLPLIVELGRVARQRALLKTKYEAQIREQELRVKGWEADRDKILRAAREGKASPEILDVLKTLDATMKQSRKVLDQIRDLDKKG